MRARRVFLLATSLALAAPQARAADPVVYTLTFAPSGDKALDRLLAENSQLAALRTTAKPAPFALIGRAQADADEFLTAAHSLGYDAAQINISIAGQALDNPELLTTLTAATGKVPVRIAVQKGPRFSLGPVTVTGLPPGFSLPLPRPGTPALAQPVLDAADTMQAALRNAGYAYASVAPPYAVADPATDTLAVSYAVTPGPRVRIGPIAFTGLQRADAGFLRAHIALRPGQSYSDASVQTARQALLDLGLFASVAATPAATPVAGRVPLTFLVSELPRHSVSLSTAYATDTGINLSTSWKDRDLFRHAETLTLTATADDLASTATNTAPGYDLRAAFAKPDFHAPGQDLNLSVEGLNQTLTAYSRRALLAGAGVSRPLLPGLTATLGLSSTSEHVSQEGIGRNYVLLQAPLTLTYTTTDSPLEPTRGFNASLSLTPTEPLLGETEPFLIAQASAATYLRLEPNAQGILALRGQIGSIQGASRFSVPPDERLYAGGSGTVRGYTYQTLGPLFADGVPEGGMAMDAINIELRQHVTGNWSVVPFLDAGQVGDTSAPFTGQLHEGAGLGVRYATSVGPIRFDVAVPFARTRGSGGFALYVGLGEAF